MPANSYRGYRFPKEIISQCVWLYFNFSLSLRDVELMMAFRGVLLTYETVRNWCDQFGPSYAAQLKRRRPKIGDKWHLDEVFLKINGVQDYLWRAVDQHGTVINILVQPKRDRRAAILFFRKTTAPHLHFQVTDRPSPLKANGLPFVFNQFIVTGIVSDSVYGAGEKFSDAIPLPILDRCSPQRDTMPWVLDISNFE